MSDQGFSDAHIAAAVQRLERESKEERAALYAALAKAQGQFPAIPRNRTVTVQTKTGGKYTFDYAPLETILDHVRGPLADNELALTQPIESDGTKTFLVTRLLHSAGGTLSSRLEINNAQARTPQEFGSILTYLRRYSIQSILGIATEEDDDANAAEGNTVAAKRDRPTRTAGGAETPTPQEPVQGAAPQAAPAPPPAAETAEEALSRLKTWWNEQDGRGLPAKIAKVDDTDRLRLLLEIEGERQLEGKPQRKTIQVALSSRIRELEGLDGEPTATTDAPADDTLSPEAAQDGPVTEPASPSETEPGEDGLDTRSTSPGSTNGEVLRLKAALGWIQDQPSSVDNPQLWTVKDVLWALSQRGGGTFGLIEEIPPEWLEAIWVAIPEGVRSSVEMLGPEAKAALAAKAT